MKSAFVVLLIVGLVVSTAAFPTLSSLENLLFIATKFYGAQRCGDANNWILATDPDGTTCHLQDGPGFTAMPTIDLTGGWHDAGDHIKFTLTNAYAAYVLLKAYDAFPTAFADNYNPSYGPADGIPDVLNEVKVATDYLLKLLITSTDMIAQVGDGGDHNVFYTSPKQSSTSPPSQGGGARPVVDGAQGDYMSLTAAALALMSIYYKQYDSTYATKCLNMAETLYTLAGSHVGSTSNNFYPPSSNYYLFDFAGGAIELYRATGQQSYLTKALSYMGQTSTTGWVASWANHADFVHHSFYKAGQTAGQSNWQTDVNNYLTKVQPTSTANVGGLAYFADWGTLRYALGASFGAMLYWQSIGSPANSNYVSFAMGQLDYVTGNNPYSRSFVIGYGNNPPTNPQHRNSFGKDRFPNNADPNDKNMYSLVGALVGGPNMNAQGSFPAGYEDVASDYSENEVALDYNAALVGMTSAAFVYYGGSATIAGTSAPAGTPTPSAGTHSGAAATLASSGVSSGVIAGAVIGVLLGVAFF